MLSYILQRIALSEDNSSPDHPDRQLIQSLNREEACYLLSPFSKVNKNHPLRVSGTHRFILSLSPSWLVPHRRSLSPWESTEIVEYWEQAQREATKMIKGKAARFTTIGERNWDYFTWRGQKKKPVVG